MGRANGYEPPPSGEQAEDYLLDFLAQEMARAKMISDRAFAKATDPWAPPGDTARYQDAAAAYRVAVAAYKQELDRVEARSRDLGTAYLRKRSQEWYDKLLSVYGERGGQYHALCATLAPLITRAEAAAQGKLRLTPEQHVDLGRTVSNIIAQLQKHTESTKTTNENISKGALLVLGIVERRLGTQPRLVQEIFQDAKDEVERISLVEAKALGPGGES